MSDIQTLIDTISEQNLGNTERGFMSLERQDFTNELLLSINENILLIRESLFTFFEDEQERYNESQLAAIERMREQRTSVTGESKLGKIEDPSVEVSGGGLFAAVLATLPMLTIGLFEGLFDSLRVIFRNIPFIKKLPVLLSRLFSPITNLFERNFGQQSKFFGITSRFFTAVKKIGEAFGMGLDGINSGIRDIDGRFRKLTGFEKIAKSIGSFFRSINQTAAKVFDFFNPGNILKPITDSAGRFKTFFTTTTDVLKSVGSVLRNVGRLLGRLFAPIAIIMGIFDTVTGAIDGFNETEGTMVEKLIGAVFGGIKGLVTGIFGSILDLLKDGVSFILDLVGLESASDFLDSFTFTEIIGDAIDSVRDFYLYIFNALKKIVTSVTDGLAKIKDNVTSFIKNPFGFFSDDSPEDTVAPGAAAATEPSLPPPPSDLFQVMNNQGEVASTFATYEEASARAAELGGGAYAMANPNPTPAEEQTIAATEKTADATELLVDKATEKGSLYVHDVHLEEAITPLVEAMSSFLNAAQTSDPSSSTSLFTTRLVERVQNQNQISPTTINQNVGGTPNGVLNSPVSEASRNVQSAASVPIIISNSSGGSSISTNVNNNSTTMIGGGPSARSSDASHRRLQDRMQGVV